MCVRTHTVLAKPFNACSFCCSIIIAENPADEIGKQFGVETVSDTLFIPKTIGIFIVSILQYALIAAD